MRTRFLSALLLATAALPAGAMEPPSAFPRVNWFRQHFTSAPARVELAPPRRLSEFVASGRLELSLGAYIELVLQNSTDIALARLKVEAPVNNVTRAFSAYDPALSASFSSTRATQTSLSALDGAPTVKTLSQPFGGSYSQLFASGTTVNVRFDAQRYSTNQTFSTYNPILSSNLTVSFDHPLLRDRGGSLAKMTILAARSAVRTSRYQFLDQVASLLAAAENVYWDVVQARENVAQAVRFADLRAAALDRARKEVEAGAKLPLELYQPESDYASSQLSVIQAKRYLAQRENALRQQMGADLDPEIRSLPIALTEPLTVPPVVAPDREAAVQNALRRRPDRLAALATLDADDISIRRATESLRPDLALTGSYLSQGVSGTYLTTGAPGGLGDALNQMFNFGFPVYSMGVRLRLPVRDRAGAADLADAQLRRKADALQVRKLEQNLRRQVLEAVENLEVARASLEQAQLARDFAEKRFTAEQKKYELQITQLYFVLTAQTALNSAENSVLEQTINYRRYLANYYQMTGQLLEQRGVVVQ
jgi:outer membrane protein TolC